MDDTPVVLHIDRIESEIGRLAKVIDSTKSGSDSREIHNFLQDDLMPLLALVAGDMRALATVVMDHEDVLSQHDESISQMDSGQQGDGTQIQAEHAAEIVEHIQECGKLLQQLYDQSKASGTPIEPLKARIEKGAALVEFIESVTMEEDDDEDEEEEAN